MKICDQPLLLSEALKILKLTFGVESLIEFSRFEIRLHFYLRLHDLNGQELQVSGEILLISC